MSTVRSFSSMLNEYLPNRLLKEEFIKRDWLLNNLEKDDSWEGSKIIVPFKAAGASSVRMGALTGATDIAEDLYVRGSIDDYIEAWGSMIFNQRDLVDHQGVMSEASFLKILPDTIEDFLDYMKMVASIQLGTGPKMAVLTANGTAGGVAAVTKIDRFQLNQKVTLDDNDSAAVSVYVIAINIDAMTVTVSATRGGAALDISAYTVAQGAAFYTDDANTTSFTSVKSALLSLANGGSANLHGVPKLSYPYLQAVNVSGAAITAANILDSIFDAYTQVRQKAKGRPDKVLMSYKHLGSILKLLQNSVLTGNYNASESGRKSSTFGWEEIMITSVKGTLTLVALQEWDDDVIAFIDMKSMVFRSKGMFKRRKNPDTGSEFFEIRNTTGYQYIVDICLFGELEVTKPGHNGIIHSIPNY